MNRLIRSIVWGLLFVAVSAVAESTDSDMFVTEAWIREAPPMAKALAGYMRVVNNTGSEQVLVGASSPAFDFIMLHRTVVSGGIAKMVHQRMIPIAAGGELVFEPNGYHLMMMKPLQRFKSGDAIKVQLKFKDGRTVDASFSVRPLGFESE